MSKVQEAIDVGAFPGLGVRVVGERSLVGPEFGGVELATTVLDRNWMHVVEHLVVDDRLDEVSRNERPIQSWVDSDEPVLDGIGSHFDAVMAFGFLVVGPAPGNGEV